MRISEIMSVTALTIFSLVLSPVSLAQVPATVYVPFVLALTGGWPTPLPGETWTFTRWESTLGLFNNSDTPATYAQKTLFGKGAGLAQPPGCESAGTLAPHTGTNVIVCYAPAPDRGFGFLAVDTPAGVVVHSDVQRTIYRCNCSDPGCDSIPQGQTGTPAYRGLFQAGSSVVSGAVELGNFLLSCASPKELYRRRVNVTLFNGGDVPATFTVTVLPVHFSGVPLSRETVVVDAKDVIQINSLPVPTEFDNNLANGFGGNRIWITITADQPFLSYVSTIFDNPEPGAMPFEVYPSVLRN